MTPYRSVRLVFRLSAWLGVAMFLIYAGLQYQFTYTRTTVAQQEFGRVYPLEVHGRIVYLTYSEERTLNVLSWGAGSLLLVAVFLEFVTRRRVQ